MLIGLICPFGYEVNALGNACMLKAKICDTGMRLNYAKNACIPEPVSYIPFPLIISCVLLSLLAIGSKIKYKYTQLATSLISIISIVETCGLLL